MAEGQLNRSESAGGLFKSAPRDHSEVLRRGTGIRQLLRP